MRYQEPNNPLFSFILPRLPSFPLPPLPCIKDDDLRKSVFTHVSIQGLNRRGVMSLSEPEEGWEKARDYERLEHVGDGLLESIASGLIQDLYPWLRHGGAAMIRDHLVANSTLAQLSVAYSLPSQLIADPSSIDCVKVSEKIQASILEAYMAAVFYSFLKHGDVASSSYADAEFALSRTSHRTSALAKYEEVMADPYEGLENIGRTSPLPVHSFNRILEPLHDTSRYNDNAMENMQPEPMRLHQSGQSATADLEDLVSGMMLSSTGVNNRMDTIDILPTSANTRNITVSHHDSVLALPLLQQTRLLASDLEEPIHQARKSTEARSPEYPSSQQLELFCRIPSSQSRLPLLEPTPFIGNGTGSVLPSLSLNPPLVRTKGQAYDHLISWLIPLLTPYCRWIHALLLREQQRILSSLPPEIPRFEIPGTWAEEDEKAKGSVRALAQHPLVEGGRGELSYEKASELGRGWKVICTLIDGERKVWRGEAIRGSHKAAKVIAVWSYIFNCVRRTNK